jgi:signal transduction histidine kinase
MLRWQVCLRLLAAFAVAVNMGGEPAPKPSRRTILVLLTGEPARPFAQLMLEGIQRTLQARIDITTYIEFLGSNALRSAEMTQRRENLIAAQYRNEPIDTLVAIGDVALPFASELRQRQFPASRILFAVTSKSSIPKDLHQGEGLFVDMNPLPAITFVLERMPAISRLFVISGIAPADVGVRESFQASIPRLPRKLDITFLTGLTLPELVQKTRQLRQDSLVVLTSNLADRSGRASSNVDQAREISAVSQAPLVEASDVSLGLGSIGGDVTSFQLMGVDLGRRILRSSDQPEPSGVVFDPAPRLRAVDWRQLQRFGISASSIPKDYEVLNWEPSFWEQHRKMVLVSLAILLLQALLISFLLAERRRRSQSQARMQKQLELEAAITKVSARISQTSRGDLDRHLEAISEELAGILGIDRVMIWLDRLHDSAPGAYHLWPSSTSLATSFLDVGCLPYIGNKLRSGEEVLVDTPDALPLEASTDRKHLEVAGIASLLLLPLRAKQSQIGALVLGSGRRSIVWREEVISTIRIAASVIAQAISRVNAEERERRSEEDTRAILASFPGFVAIVNEEGEILRLGDRLGFGKQCPNVLKTAATGDNLLTLWLSEPNGYIVAKEVQAVLDGSAASIVEHRYDYEKETRWIEIRARRISQSERGAIVSHLDVTDRKAIESENSVNRETLWHLNRVASLGELSASLAHEINQPLAGILSSAEAAAMLLDQPEPDLVEMRAAIQDIITDDQRAGDIINKMRSMLRRKNQVTGAIDVNATVQDTLRLLLSEARLKHVAIDASFAQEIPLAAAEPVQLQQVLVNLITNAIEAVQTMPPDRRIVSIETGFQGETQSPFVEVRDHGPGIPEHLMTRVFEPFITTKDSGLGLGLSICRSIIESIGGEISAQNSPGGGARFRFVLRPHKSAVPMAPNPARVAAAG